MIRLSLLGAVDLRGPDDDELRTVLAQPKRLALLSYLAVAHSTGLHSRDTLLALLWPDLDQGHARAALRQAVYALRHALGDGVMVTCGDAVIGLNRQKLWCDVTAFEAAMAAGHFVDALALYAGELLTGFHVPGTPELERWLDRARDRLSVLAEAAAWTLSESEERGGDLGGALQWARRLFLINPGDERALRRVVTLLVRLGDRVGALRVYQAFAHHLAADFDLEPTPETRALISAIGLRVRRSIIPLIVATMAVPAPV